MATQDQAREDENLLGFQRAFNAAEQAARQDLEDSLRTSPIPRNERMDNLALFADHLLLGRILFMDHIYRLILNTPGVVMEFGTRWGQNLSIFSNLRTLYEPTHYHRKIIGFDTFSGFVDIAPQDGDSIYAQPGNVRTTQGYETFLDRVLSAQEAFKPLPHKKKYEIVKGDARQTLPLYLERHPQTIIALAYLDMDLYAPTRDVLTQIRPYLTRGSVVVLDEINDPGFPGETVALREVFGLTGLRLQRVPYLSFPCYFVHDIA
ncbi:TylF/MycF/NovP-related O-methyltransferase [Methylorubrum salsuginis]|uniref:Macrocin-O-methyltransferase (TylF) n=1 Tax=Methylorubrum salsuginis TaxID=414703 RepID=A0A1I4N0N8_9HYPH|nr:TylF/MycF/NovP-related O-methyltransferase [Methylorubrum salsuginis]SFM09144.1 Macrocin-O-methyltransferase (TylF) [Methylorubrum salsuginis]